MSEIILAEPTKTVHLPDTGYFEMFFKEDIDAERESVAAFLEEIFRLIPLENITARKRIKEEYDKLKEAVK